MSENIELLTLNPDCNPENTILNQIHISTSQAKAGGNWTGMNYTLFNVKGVVKDYCDYLRKNTSGGSVGMLEKLKIDSILQKLGENIVKESLMNKLEKIDKHVSDFISIKMK
jgi:hypothetical protein